MKNLYNGLIGLAMVGIFGTGCSRHYDFSPLPNKMPDSFVGRTKVKLEVIIDNYDRDGDGNIDYTHMTRKLQQGVIYAGEESWQIIEDATESQSIEFPSERPSLPSEDKYKQMPVLPKKKHLGSLK